MPDDFMESFRELAEELDANHDMDPVEVIYRLALGAGPLTPIGRGVFRINITAVLRYFILMGLINRLLKRWIPDIQRDAGSLLCSGSYGVKSTEMGRNIFKLSVTARRSPDVVAMLKANDPDEVLPILRDSPAAKPFLAALESFLDEHGHRALKEFDMASVRFEENPAPVLAMIRNYLASDSDPDEMEQHTTDARVALAESIQEKLLSRPGEASTRWRWRLLEYLSARCRHFVKLRENSRFYHIMTWYSVRKKILSAEAQLLNAGKLKVRGDIFFLHWVEVQALMDDHLDWPDVEETIRARRMRQVRWTKQGAPKLINIHSTVQPRAPASENELVGQGASPGDYEGVARVILDPSVNADIQPGEILVAPYTDPAWTPLFLVARAAVVGVGSYLSHAGTIAREYGMPCVVDVDGCTDRIRTGDRLHVDGTNGTVTLLNTAEAA